MSEATKVDISESVKTKNKMHISGTRRTELASDVPNTTRVLSLRPSSCTPRRSGELAPSSVSKPLFHARSPSNPGAPLAGTKGVAAKGDPCVMSTRVDPTPAGGVVDRGGR